MNYQQNNYGGKTMKNRLFKGAAFLALVFGTTGLVAACGQQQVAPTEKVVWSGVDDIELDMGDAAPNLLLGVVATQGDKTLTVRIDNEKSDEVNTDVAGAFSIYYVAYDGDKAVDESLNGEVVRTVSVLRGTHVDNNEFKSNDKRGWGGNGNAGSEMTWDIDTAQQALVVNITKSGNEYWQNQVEFNGLTVKANTTYEITIRAKSATPRNIGASLEVPALGYRCIDKVSVNSVGYTMTTSFADYKFYYTAEENFDGVKFGIILGRFNELDETANTVTIDKVEVKKMAKQANSTGVTFTGESHVEVRDLAEYRALPAVTATKGGQAVTLTKEGAVQGVEFNEELATAVFGEMWKYVDGDGNLSYFRRQITYKAPAPARAHDYDTLDGDFEYGLKFWNPERNDIVSIEEDKTNQVIEIASVKAAPSGEADWRGQLQQNNNGGKLEKDHAYKMVVEAKIDNINVTTLRAEFCAGAGNPAAKKDMVFTAANTYQTFETDPFQPTVDVTGGGYRVGLLIGEYSEAYHLTVKSIHVEEVEPEVPYVRTTDYETMNGDFAMGLKYWIKEENNLITIAENTNNTVKITSAGETGSDADWKAQLQQNNNGGKLTAGKAYKAVVVAKTNNKDVTTLRLEFCAGAGNPNAKKDMVFTANDTFQTFETALFVPAEDVTGGNYRVGLLLGEYTGAWELIVDSIQIIEVASN